MALIVRELAWLSPIARKQFEQLAYNLRKGFLDGRTKTDFQPFETFRHPDRQTELEAGGVSKAGAWESSHQYGLAVDFVPYRETWTWAADEDWEFLRIEAVKVGLSRPIKWDLAHVEHPLFAKELWPLLRRNMINK